MVLVVQDIHEISIEGMDVIQLRKLVQDGCQFVTKVLLGEFYLAGVEGPYSGYLVVLVDHSRCLALCLRQNNIYEVLGGGYHGDLLEVVVSHLCSYSKSHVFGRY